MRRRQRPLVGRGLLSKKVGAHQRRLAKLLTNRLTVLREHPSPTHARGTKRSNVRDDHSFREAEIPNLDSGLNSDACVTDNSDSEECNEDAAADVPESDDPELAHAGPALSAKHSAEVFDFLLSGYGYCYCSSTASDMGQCKTKKGLRSSGVPHLVQTRSEGAQESPTTRHAFKSIANNAHAQAKPTVSMRYHAMRIDTDSYHIHQRDAMNALPESENQQDAKKQTGTLDDASNALPGQVGYKWPSYSNLIWSRNGEVNLTNQTFEVKAIVRKAIPFSPILCLSTATRISPLVLPGAKRR